MGSCLLQHVLHLLYLELSPGQRFTDHVITLFWLQTRLRWHVLINSQWLLTLNTFALCLPHRGPVTCSSVEVLCRLRPLTFPSPANARMGSPVTCTNQQPFSEPLEANTLLS